MTTLPRRSFQISDLLSLNLLLIFLPLALLGRALGWGDPALFIMAALAIVPLSGLLGEATEALAARLGQRAGGLINATLGNAAELIITFFALRAGLLELVRASIIGSILGNLLLVTGFSFLVGGLKHGLQTFERRTASGNATMVILAFLVLAIPSAFDTALLHSGADSGNRELFFSEGIAAIMIVLYGLSLVYSFSNPQARLLADAEEVEEAGGNVLGEVTTPAEPAAHHASVQRALIVLALATIGIVLMSELLVSTVEPVAHGLGLSEFFVGLIIIPIIGNVAEHFVAVQVAMKNRMDLSLAISLGSSLQIALFVAPVLVFLSLFFPDNLLLVFNQYELLGLAVASITTALVSQDGESNWLEGVQLLTVYTILAMAFYLLPSTATTH